MYKTQQTNQPISLTRTTFGPGGTITVIPGTLVSKFMEKAGTSTGKGTPDHLRPDTGYFYQETGAKNGSYSSTTRTVYDNLGNVLDYGSSTSGSGILGLSTVSPVGSPNFGHVKVIQLEATLDRQLDASIRAAVKNQKFDAGAFLGELSSTVGHLAHTVNRISQAYRSLRHGNLRGVEQALGCGTLRRSRHHPPHTYHVDYAKDAGSMWLEYTYGWKPLLSDAHDAAEAFASNQLGEPPKRLKVSRTVSGSVDLSTRFSANSGTTGFTDTTSHRIDISIRRTATLKMDSPLIAKASALGLTNPLAVAWEVLPFSFVVDWFLPVGDFLGNLDALAGLSVVRSCRAVTYKGSVNKTYSAFNPRGGTSAYGARDAKIYSRTPTGLPSMPSLPSFKNPVSLSHLTSALALLDQTFRR